MKSNKAKNEDAVLNWVFAAIMAFFLWGFAVLWLGLGLEILKGN